MNKKLQFNFFFVYLDFFPLLIFLPLLSFIFMLIEKASPYYNYDDYSIDKKKKRKSEWNFLNYEICFHDFFYRISFSATTLLQQARHTLARNISSRKSNSKFSKIFVAANATSIKLYTLIGIIDI